MSLKNINALLNSAISLRSLQTKIKHSGRACITQGSAEAEALRHAVSVLDTSLEGGYRKSKGLSGSKRAEAITPNSLAVNKLRDKERVRSYRLIDAYLKVVNDAEDTA